jgi:hypothetical protein
MRTTVLIDDDLLHQVKKRAVDSGVSVSEVLNRALRELFCRQPPGDVLLPFRMVTFGRGQPRVDHRPEELARALEEEDQRSLGGGS